MTNRLARFSNESIERILKIAYTISSFPFLSKSDHDVLLNILAHSLDGVPAELKLKVYETLLRLRTRRRKPFGMLVVLGWKREWDKNFASLPDITQNLFKERRFDLTTASIERALDLFSEFADFDGAVLINARGEVVASGIYLENMRPKKVAELRHLKKSQDLSSSFGFAKKVHTRHLAAIAASYWLKGVTAFVISEEDGSLRVFEEGGILWSTVRREIEERRK